ncbi:MAG: hypothetical protein Hyperionvirus18_22 [Hyperionvirus sp.]|uniref:Uncharacterized protein n=1 Tax=Hyperionvirus sp. TaxID=2487770 RepID=A0A3G5AA54_9VIRU|nr:MAG: hypothetical protein Hyperionvirus18_22 [Hyperionvirus sp.]
MFKYLEHWDYVPTIQDAIITQQKGPLTLQFVDTLSYTNSTEISSCESIKDLQSCKTQCIKPILKPCKFNCQHYTKDCLISDEIRCLTQLMDSPACKFSHREQNKTIYECFGLYPTFNVLDICNKSCGPIYCNRCEQYHLKIFDVKLNYYIHISRQIGYIFEGNEYYSHRHSSPFSCWGDDIDCQQTITRMFSSQVKSIIYVNPANPEETIHPNYYHDSNIPWLLINLGILCVVPIFIQ